MLAFPMPRLPSPVLNRSRFKRSESLPLAVHFSQTCFVAPLFSWSYKLLFPQALCFDKHLRCPPGVTPNSSRRSGIHLEIESTPLSSYCYELFVVAKKSSALESATSTLFHKNIPVGYARNQRGLISRWAGWTGCLGKLENETETITWRLGPQLSSELV